MIDILQNKVKIPCSPSGIDFKDEISLEIKRILIDLYPLQGVKISGTWTELENSCNTVEVVETTSFEMSQLVGNTYYRIELKAHNAIGYSSPASIIMKTTRGESDSANNNLGTLLYSAGYNSGVGALHKRLFTTTTTTATSTTTITSITTATTTIITLATTISITLLSVLASMLV